MKKLITIEDSFSTELAGVIVSGVNQEFDLLGIEEIKQLIGKTVRVVEQNGQNVDVNVKEVSVSESLVGKKNISIAFGEIEAIEKFTIGSTVYSIDS